MGQRAGMSPEGVNKNGRRRRIVSVMTRMWASGCVLTLVGTFAAGCGGHKAAEPPPLIARDAVAAGGAGVLGSLPDGVDGR